MAASAEPPWMAGRAFCAIRDPEATYYERSGYRLVPGDAARSTRRAPSTYWGGRCRARARGTANPLMASSTACRSRCSSSSSSPSASARCAPPARSLYATASSPLPARVADERVWQGGAFELMGRTRNAAPPGGWFDDHREVGNSFREPFSRLPSAPPTSWPHISHEPQSCGRERLSPPIVAFAHAAPIVVGAPRTPRRSSLCSTAHAHLQ